MSPSDDRDDRRRLLEDEIRMLRLLVQEQQEELERNAGELQNLRAARDHRDAILRTRSYRYLEPARALFRRLRRSPATGSSRSFGEVRRTVAAEFLHGSGLEIGALNEPLQLPEGAAVRYVDRMTLEQLRAEYPGLAGTPIVGPDVVDDGETLSTFEDASVDFIVANHFIEHCQDPIGTLARHLAVVRPGGIVYLAVPDKRKTFDVRRPPTSLEHLVSDHHDGPARSRWEHFLEYAVAVEGAGTDRALELAERDFSIHYHVWTPETFRTFIEYCRDEAGLPFEVAAFVPNDFEFVVVLRRLDQTPPASASTSRTSAATSSPWRSAVNERS